MTDHQGQIEASIGPCLKHVCAAHGLRHVPTMLRTAHGLRHVPTVLRTAHGLRPLSTCPHTDPYSTWPEMHVHMNAYFVKGSSRSGI